MVEVIPAIIPKNFQDLEEKMSEVAGLVPLVQIDVMDGVLTPEASWPYKFIPDPDFSGIIKEEKEFPFWEKLDFEVDMMVSNPENFWFDWVSCGAKRVILHFESKKNIESLIKDFKSKMVAKESVLYIELGLALDIQTLNEKIYPLVELVDFIQFMGIAKIGFQGQPFDEKVVSKIEDFKKNFPKVPVSVDGGVNLNSAQRLVAAGADRLVSGSAIFESDDISLTIEQLRNLS
jgi:ribulose-phosphate 3-epimerase